MRLKPATAAALLAALAACGRGTETAPPDHRTEPAANAIPASNASPASNAAAPAPAPATDDPPLDALAGIKIGRTVAQLRADGLDVRKGVSPDPGSDCGYASVPALKDVALMLDGERVARIDVRTPAYATLGGVTVGMSEAEALRRLGPRAVVSPHPYTGPQGHYLTVHAEGAPMGLIIETDGNKVENWRMGQWTQVQWIEGCS